MVLAYYLTWHTYGTWLHGDERGSVDSQHNQLSQPLAPADPDRFENMRQSMKYPPVSLTEAGRQVMDQTIRRHCEIRKWRLDAVNVRTNHIHIVVGCPADLPPETAMEQFKAWGTRRLREADCISHDQPAWVEHGSTRWIKTAESLAKAIDYVLNQQ